MQVIMLTESMDTVVTTKSCEVNRNRKEGRKEMFYLTMLSTHFIYSYMASVVETVSEDCTRDY